MSAPEQFPRQLGKGMITIAWLLLLGLLYLVFSGLLENQHNPNSSVNTISGPTSEKIVRLKMNRSGHYLATGYINNKRVKFLVDTGATDVAVSERLANRLGLEKMASTISQTANGKTRSYVTFLDSVRIGDIELTNVRASILRGLGDEVLLGMSFLKHLEIQQRNNTLTLIQ